MSGRELPEGWSQAFGSDVFEYITSGSRGWAKYYAEEGALFVRVANLGRERPELDLSERQYVQPPGGTEGIRTKVRPGDILITITADLGRVAVVPHEFGDGYVNQHVALARSCKAVRSDYIAWYLLSPDGQRTLGTYNRGVTRAGLGLNDIASVDIPFAPFPEQRRIVEKIEALTTRSRRAREALDTLPALIGRYRQSILAAAFRGDLTAEWRNGCAPEQPDTADERPDMLPPEWEWQRLDTSSAVSGGLTKNKNREQFPLRRPYLRVANVYANELRLEDVQEIGVAPQELSRVMLQSGDLLLVEGNGSLDQIGRVAIWDGQVPDCVHQNHIIKVRFPDRRIAELVLYWLLSPFGRRFIEQEASSSAGLHTLSLSKVSRLPIPVPSIDEAEAIVGRIRAAFEGLSRFSVPIDAATARLATLDQSILAKAFRGELVPQDPNDEPASVLLERIRAERAAAGPAPRRGRRPKVAGGG